MATKKKPLKANGNGNGSARDDAVVAALQRILEELRANTHRVERVEQGLHEVVAELRATRDILVKAQTADRHRIDGLETRVAALEAGKH